MQDNVSTEVRRQSYRPEKASLDAIPLTRGKCRFQRQFSPCTLFQASKITIDRLKDEVYISRIFSLIWRDGEIISFIKKLLDVFRSFTEKVSFKGRPNVHTAFRHTPLCL